MIRSKMMRVIPAKGRWDIGCDLTNQNRRPWANPVKAKFAMRVIALLLALVAAQCWAAEKPRIVFIAGEYEYKSTETLPPFANELAREFAVETVMLQRPGDQEVQSIPGLEALRDADLAVLFVRRMTLPENELAEIRKYLEGGETARGVADIEPCIRELEGVRQGSAGRKLPGASWK